jgi:hypothetical protein
MYPTAGRYPELVTRPTENWTTSICKGVSPDPDRPASYSICHAVIDGYERYRTAVNGDKAWDFGPHIHETVSLENSEPTDMPWWVSHPNATRKGYSLKTGWLPGRYGFTRFELSQLPIRGTKKFGCVKCLHTVAPAKDQSDVI